MRDEKIVEGDVRILSTQQTSSDFLRKHAISAENKTKKERKKRKKEKETG